MLSVAITEEQVEAALARRLLACPDCAAPLAPWGFARSRQVRMRHDTRWVTPRRALCERCGVTHVLCPAWSVPRRRDGAEVIGEALRRAANGDGHRRVAIALARPPGTVRGWLRSARTRAETLRAGATRLLLCLDPEPDAITPADSTLGEAVEAIMLAVRAWVLRFGPSGTGPWERAVSLTGGLLYGQVPLPP
jgi:hypothetical protein